MTARTTRRRTDSRSGRRLWLPVAGALLFAAGVVAFMGIITAEALYPEGYSTSQNEISDLGATRPPDSVIAQPSATIFNSVMIAAGVLVIAAALCLHGGSKRKAPAILLGLFGLGVLGVGVFPGDHGNVHALFALLTFIAGGLAAILSVMVAKGPFRYFSVLLGAVGLLALLLYAAFGDANPMAGLGDGGIERWVAYPVLLWMTGFGGHLMGRSR